MKQIVMRLNNVYRGGRISLFLGSLLLSCNPVVREPAPEDPGIHSEYIPIIDNMADSLYMRPTYERDCPEPLYPMMPVSDNLYREHSFDAR